MVTQTNLGSTYNILALPFSATNIGDADGTLNSVQADTDVYTMPAAGSVIGFSAYGNAQLTTGTLDFHPTVNGSLMPAFDGDTAQLHSLQQNPYRMQEARKNLFTFTAGQRIGLNWEKTGTVDPTTTDASAVLIVLLEDVDY